MLGSLKDSLAQAIDGKTACLFFSGGSDSLLLLNVLLEMDAGFSLLTMDASFSPAQKRVIDQVAIERNVKVLTYQPARFYFVGDGKKLAFVEEYEMLDGTPIPFIRDCVPGGGCSFDLMIETRAKVPAGFEVNIFGTRKTDRHWAFGKIWPEARVQLGYGEIFAPLWEWTRADVSEGLKSYGLRKPKLDTGNYEYCTECLAKQGRVFCPKQQKEIDAVDWDARAMLGGFQERFKGREN